MLAIEPSVLARSLLSDRKGVNVPGVVLSLSALTDKDRADLDFGLTLVVAWIALSFVQRAADIAKVKEIMQGRAGICAKPEKPAAIDCLDEILAATDAVMVARGDLGVELPAEQVPALQKRIVRECRRLGKPVIVATRTTASECSEGLQGVGAGRPCQRPRRPLTCTKRSQALPLASDSSWPAGTGW